MKKLGILLLLLLTFALLTSTAFANDPAIFPGEGMGKISIKETRTSVLKKLGKPTQSFFWDSANIRQDAWIGGKTKSRLIVLYINVNSTDLVAQIETTSPGFLTPQGLSIKSSVSQIDKYMGSGGKVAFLKSRDKGDIYAMIYSPRKGIAFFRNVSSGKSFSEKVIVFSNEVTNPVPLVSFNVYEQVRR